MDPDVFCPGKGEGATSTTVAGGRGEGVRRERKSSSRWGPKPPALGGPNSSAKFPTIVLGVWVPARKKGKGRNSAIFCAEGTVLEKVILWGPGCGEKERGSLDSYIVGGGTETKFPLTENEAQEEGNKL